jgi:hypothetical protein
MIEKVISPKKLVVPKKLKALVIDACKRHAWNIGVSNYRADILYMEDDEKYDDSCTLASCNVDRRYLHATIKIFPEAIRRWESEGNQMIEHMIAHEVAHIATQHFYDVATARYCDTGEMKDAWETVTEVRGRLSERLDQKNKNA